MFLLSSRSFVKVSLWTKTIGFREGVGEGVALVFLSLRVTFAVKVSLSVEISVFALGGAHCVLRLL